MKSIKIMVFALSAAAVLFSCAPELPNNTVEIDKYEAKEQIDMISDIVILDVRTPEEWSQGIIENAVKLDFKSSDFEEKVALLNKDAHTIVYCKSGGRSGKATKLMSDLGFKNIYNLTGGYDEFVK